MKITRPFIVIATIICMAFMNVAMANPDKTLEKRIDRIEKQVKQLKKLTAGLQAELERVSPDADLTGKTYCLIGQGTGLTAEVGVSASVNVNPFSGRLDFTSPTQVTLTELYDLLSTIEMPSNTMSDTSDPSGSQNGTYTVVGNRLAVTFDDEGEAETDFFYTHI